MRPEKFINRELSWLEFNARVLEEASDKSNPLFECLKFISIFSSNLDEFFMVRVATVKDRINIGIKKTDASGLTPDQQMERISIRAHELVNIQNNLFNKRILKELQSNGLKILKRNQLTKEQEEFLEGYYINYVYPVLTPMAFDSSRPFPHILNKSLNIGVLVQDKEDEKGHFFAAVQIPSVLPRIVKLPVESGEENYIMLEEIVKMHINRLFAGNEILCAYPFRITRNADIDFKEEEAESVLLEIEKRIKKRRWGAAVRLEVAHNIDQRLLVILKEELELEDKDIYYSRGPLDLTFLMKLSSMVDYEHLKYPVYVPNVPLDLLNEEEDNIFEIIKKKDVFLHHPYESFEPVIRFVQEAAHDPAVLAIKQTLYRVSGDSPIIKALAQAADNGKQVTVLVELKARFDEEKNIQWAKRLELAGCHVIYGLVGLKTHCKITLVVRKEESGIKRYVHMGTGNYNDITAKIYTDMGLFTCNEYIGADASALFNMLTGYSEPPGWYKIATAPIGLREKFLELIKNETSHALDGQKAGIIAKMNSLVDTEIIMALYEASRAGVTIDLIIRGICCLKPGIPYVSENISVRSIVGRFLEHSRIYYFYNNGREDLFLSSADWMPRNLDHRVETMFPIENRNIKERILGKLHIELEDNVKARVLMPEGNYKKQKKRGNKLLNSQEYFCVEAENAGLKQRRKKGSEAIIIPITGIDKLNN